MSNPVYEPMLPAHRTPPEQLAAQRSQLMASADLLAFIDSIPAFVFVLNRDRALIYANQALLDFLGATDPATVVGMRPGEIVNCLNAIEAVDGCGTGEPCRLCGAASALKSALSGESAVEECRIRRRGATAEEVLDLKVWTRPVTIAGERCVFFSALDNSSEKRRRVLERVFFHDVMNTAGALSGFVELLKDATEEEIEEFVSTIGSLSHRVIDEIAAHRDLMAAESGDLVVRTRAVDIADVVLRSVSQSTALPAAEGKRVVAGVVESAVIQTDPILLGRVLFNMLKNALEASRPGDKVTADAIDSEGAVEFRVHNPAYMPISVQMQLFQRSFSTKGEGRGLGTYSMKLLGERHLGGIIGFKSTPEAGTSFFVRLPR